MSCNFEQKGVASPHLSLQFYLLPVLGFLRYGTENVDKKPELQTARISCLYIFSDVWKPLSAPRKLMMLDNTRKDATHSGIWFSVSRLKLKTVRTSVGL
jgi:hypothetical protein